MNSKRITIRKKKVAIIREQVSHMQRTLDKMNAHLQEYDGNKEMTEVWLDAHFESLRVSSGNLSLVLEDDRNALAILYESALMCEQLAMRNERMTIPNRCIDCEQLEIPLGHSQKPRCWKLDIRPTKQFMNANECEHFKKEI